MAIRISATQAIAAPPRKVWEIVADLDREPEFWRGTQTVRTLEVSPEGIRREVTLAFGGRRCEELVHVTPGQSLVHEILRGPMVGKKIVSLRQADPGTLVEVTWDIKLAGFLKLTQGVVRRHVEEGSKKALQRIQAAAEGWKVGGDETAAP